MRANRLLCRCILTAIATIALIGSGCAGYRYRVSSESTPDVARVRDARHIWARELVVSFEPPPEWEYPPDRWSLVESELAESYAAWIVDRVQGPARTVSVVPAGQPVTDGVILETDLTKIERGSHGWTGMGMGMTKNEVGWATIVFRDGKSHEVLYRTEISMEAAIGSTSAGPGFEDRVKWLMWNSANAVRDIVDRGPLGQGMHTQKERRQASP